MEAGVPIGTILHTAYKHASGTYSFFWFLDKA